jgi:squalene-associated FAD-dependent desaturase
LTRFLCSRLPAPIHAFAGLARLPGLTLRDKLAALRVGGELRNISSDQALTVTEWLDRLGQSERMKELFWHPLAIATLNENPRVASATMLKTVLRFAFFKRAADSRIGLARVGLGDLYTGAARDFIEKAGGSVRTRAAVKQFVIDGKLVAAAELVTGERVEADSFISAVPPNSVAHLIPPGHRNGDLAGISALGSSPILSINLWFDRPITDKEFVGLLGTRIQWLFNKDAIFSLDRLSNQVALVISAARDYVDWPSSRIVEMAIEELRTLFPPAREAVLVHKRVIKERDATLAHTVDSDRLRPGPNTPLDNLFLAGDWTDTGLPATIESAVLSGYRAAARIG